MNDILVASSVLAAYLVSSAEAGSITSNRSSRRMKGEYSSRSISATAGLSVPIITLSGVVKSGIALPSFRNSGLLAQSNGS